MKMTIGKFNLIDVCVWAIVFTFLQVEELSGYKTIPKGMLQIYINQTVLSTVLKQIFVETLDS